MCFKQSAGTKLLLLFSVISAVNVFSADSSQSPTPGPVDGQQPDESAMYDLSADDAYVRVIDLLSDGRQALAEEYLESDVKRYPRDIRLLFAKAVLERSRWDKSAAGYWFAGVMAIGGDKALERAAWLSVRLDQKDSVEENLGEMIRLSEENPENLFLLWLGAIHCREQCRGRLYGNKEIAELGRERYEMLLDKFRIGPVMVHHTYANILTENLGDSKAAYLHRMMAVSMEAKSWSLEGLADTLTELGNYRWACVTWEQSVKISPSPHCYGRWGDALFALEEYEEAEHKYREAFRLQPHGRFIAQIAQCWEHLGTDVHPLSKTEFVREAQRAGYEFHTNTLTNDVSKDQYPMERFKKWSTMVQDQPEDASGHLELGHCYAGGFGTTRDTMKARACYEKAVELAPDNWSALNSLAANLTDGHMGNPADNSRALDLAKRAVQAKENAATLQTLAVVYFSNKQFEEAIGAYERLIAFWKTTFPHRDVPDQFYMGLDMAKGAGDRERKKMRNTQ